MITKFKIYENQNYVFTLPVNRKNNQLCVEFLNSCQNFYTFINQNKNDIKYFVIKGKINNQYQVLIWKDGVLYKNKKRTQYKMEDIYNFNIDKLYMNENTLWKKFSDEIDTIAYSEESTFKWDFKNRILIFDNGSEYKYSLLTEEIVEL